MSNSENHSKYIGGPKKLGAFGILFTIISGLVSEGHYQLRGINADAGVLMEKLYHAESRISVLESESSHGKDTLKDIKDDIKEIRKDIKVILRNVK